MTNVVDKKVKVPNDQQFGRFSRQQHDFVERVKKGSLPADQIGELLQLIVDGKLSDWQGLVIGTHEISVAKLLQAVGVATIPATTELFVAKDNFRLKKDGGICSYIDKDFTEWFLKGDGKIEDPISEQTLHYAKLCRRSVDGPIITELGGEVKAETTLIELFSLMEKQAKGEEGALLTNGSSNIFYILDGAGVLRTVSVYWNGDGWGVSARSVKNPHGWPVGSQVFSRNSGSLEPLARMTDMV